MIGGDNQADDLKDKILDVLKPDIKQSHYDKLTKANPGNFVKK